MREVYFLHIPKTAGTSLAQIIRSAFPYDQGLPAHELHELVRLNRTQIQSFRCYSGHFGAGLYSLLDREIPTITLLRDPFERSISQLQYALKFVTPSLPMAENQSVQSYILNRIQHFMMHPLEKLLKAGYGPIGIEDFQVRSLGIDVDLTQLLGKQDVGAYESYIRFSIEDDRKAILAKAKSRLDTMAVVGTVERFEESVALVCDYLQIARPEFPPVENVARGHSIGKSYRNSGRYSQDLIETIESMTQNDRILYEYANQLLDAKLARSSKLPKT